MKCVECGYTDQEGECIACGHIQDVNAGYRALLSELLAALDGCEEDIEEWHTSSGERLHTICVKRDEIRKRLEGGDEG